MPRDNKLTKSIGEHFVCSALAQVGWAASLTRDGIARTDILAVRAIGGEMIQVQVKTSSTVDRHSFYLGEVAPAIAPNEWFVLVAIGASVRDRPRCFVVPRDHVSAGNWISHHAWLNEPNAPRKRSAPVSQSRPVLEEFVGYEERWDLLTASSVPVLLGRRRREEMHRTRIGLPPRHPWTSDPPTEWPGPIG